MNKKYQDFDFPTLGKVEQRNLIRDRVQEKLETLVERYPDDALRATIAEFQDEIREFDEATTLRTYPLPFEIKWRSEPPEQKHFPHIEREIVAYTMSKRKVDFNKYTLEELQVMRDTGRKFPVFPVEEYDTEDEFHRPIEEEMEDLEGYEIRELDDIDFDELWDYEEDYG